MLNFELFLRRYWLMLGIVSMSALAMLTFRHSYGPRSYSLNQVLPQPHIYEQNAQHETYEATLVVASMKVENTSWLDDYRPEWDKKIYVTDDQNASLNVPMNKGREAMVYLTYIIDHYDELAPVTIFHHAARYQWHNDDPLYDGRRMLDRLQINHILSRGYANLRCVWTLGCPAEIHPIDEQVAIHSDEDRTGTYYSEAFAELFPGMPMPEAVGVSCCAQFAASRDKIRQRPLLDYIRFRDWLISSDLQDHVSGRILEYSWHIIFGEKAVFCPDAKTCYCQVYGLCNLECGSEGTCESQYTLARYATMPQGWPEIGWDGETRNITKLREEQAADYKPRLDIAG
ncbi:hypothetical protein AMS68_005162 [Peltaster fructicola]|uniref:Uncharacterized protein n=1 Tax=Peltaster fructicola TaxID=286661 RepID=A0A6H0XYB0_9PEZI|nr:hypothetical protein AMS68_005162 [Peltaster fructicola]